MATIDDKVVAMSFESGKFETGVTKTLSMLDRLKAALNFGGAGKGLDQINASANRVNLSHIANGVDAIRGKFSALSVAALAAFATIATQAVMAGIRVAKSFTIDPIISGFKEYETGLNSVQTILSNTAAAGTNLKDVNSALAELNQYADLTIYKFGDMTRNIGTFTAAGVDLKTSVASIKGIANLAALSGSSAEQASTAMYQLSQAISAGRVNLQDWNSVVNAGMGGTIFQRALAQTAVHMGVLDKNAVQLKGSMKNVTIEGKSFRESIMAAPGKQSWLTGDVLTKTLSQLSGNLSDAQLKAEGYTAAEIKAIQTQAKQALEAATQVKTLSQLLDTTKEALGSGWAQTWQIIFGDFGEAKTLFTGLANSIGGFVKRSADARNKVLKDWRDLGGRTLLLAGLKKMFFDLGLILKPIKDAFRDIFPAKTGQDLYNITLRFKQFMDTMHLWLAQGDRLQNLHRTFRGLFAVLDIGKQIISGVFSMFGKLFGVVGKGSGGFLEITGSIGDFLVKVDQALKKGGLLRGFFQGLGTVLAVPLHILGAVAKAIANLFSGIGNASGLTSLGGSLSPLTAIINAVSNAWDKFVSKLSGANSVIQPLMQGLGNLVSGLGDAISNAMSSINWGTVLETIKVGLLGGIFLIFRNFFKGANLQSLAGGFLGGITGPFEALTGSMKAMQTQIKAKTLLEIAAAVGILALSLVALSTINPKKLDTALTGMTMAFGELIGAMALLSKINTGSFLGFAKIPVIAGSLILLAGAVGLLVLSVKALSNLSWNELVKGLTGVGVLLATITVAAGPLSRSALGMTLAGVGITAIAVAMKILASAMKDFGGMSWESLAKGLGSVAISLGVIAVAARVFPRNMVGIGAGLILVAAGLKILASAIGDLGRMDVKTLAKGIGSVAASLLIMAGAMRIMPRGMTAQAAGLILVAVALQGIARAVGTLGGMSVEQIAKGLVSLGGALAILAVGLKAMSGTLAGAAALAVAAAGMRLLAPALVMIGKQSWTGIAKGMVTLAVAFGILGAAGLLLGPIAPAILAMGAALLAVGAGLALAGAGIALIGVGFAAIATSGTAAIAVVIKAVTSLLAAAPKWAIQFAAALVAFVKAIATAAPQMVTAFGQILISFLNAVIIATPKMAQAFSVLIQAGLKVLRNNFPAMVATGFQLLMNLLNGIKNNIVQVTNTVVAIIVKFLGALSARMGQIIRAGANLLISFLNGIANNLPRVITAGVNIIVKLLDGIGKNMYRVVMAGGNIIVKVIEGIGNSLWKIVNAGGDAIIKFINGVGSKGPDIVRAAANAAAKFIAALVQGLLTLVDAGAHAIINFLNGVASAIRAHDSEMWNAGFNVASAIVEGMLAGVAALGGRVLGALGGLIDKAIGLAGKLLDMGSPSGVFMEIGKNVVLGLALGIDQNTSGVIDSMTGMANGLIASIKNTFGITSPSKVMYEIGQYVGEGFRKGLTGTGENINQAFKDLNDRLSKAIIGFRKTIETEQGKIDRLRDAKHPDWKAIGEAQKVVRQNQDLLARATAGQALLTKGLTKQKTKLLELAREYINVGNKLEDANQKLKDAIQTRDDAAAAYTSQYGELPALADISETPDQLGAYVTALRNQVTAVATYTSTLDQLRTLGLDEATYRKLLSEGPADQAFASQLLAGGRTAVQGLNQLDAQLASASKTLATRAATNLYQAGVDSAQGYLNGLKARQKEIIKEMTNLADRMIKTLKKKLKIKSPSEVFGEVGRLSLEGLAKGFDNPAIIKNIGNKTLDALKKNMRTIGDYLSSEIDANPTITPVLNLSAIESEAQRMSRMLNNVVPINTAASFGRAAAISLQTPETSEELAASAGRSIKFEQNNYSPEALSPVEIYRQTRNQLSLARAALT